MANTSISNLSAGAAVSATDLVPNVQTVGVGPVKTTADQLKTFMSASPTLVTPALGTPTSGNFSTGTFTWPTFNQNTSGTAAGLSATLAVGSGGTGTSTAFTAGSVVFAGTSGVYSQANSQLFWNNTNNRLGIGTSSPSVALHAKSASPNFYLEDTGAKRTTLSILVQNNEIRFQGTAFVDAATPMTFHTNNQERMQLTSSGNCLIGTTTVGALLTVAGPIATAVPTTKTVGYSLTATDSSLIFNGAGSITLTLQAASSYPGRILYVKTIAAQTVVSASSNVVPIDSSVAGTAILAATAGKWAMLQSDGTNWVIMMAA